MKQTSFNISKSGATASIKHPMNQEVPAEVLEAFTRNHPEQSAFSTGKISAEPIGGGLINHSFLVRGEQHPGFFLQKINTAVFTQPLLLQQNYQLLWQYLLAHPKQLLMPKPLYPDQQSTLFTDQAMGQWRAFEYVEDSISYSNPATAAMAGNVALAFARFTAGFEGMPAASLQPVIPHFHDLAYRYRQFQDALQTNAAGRLDKAGELVRALQARTNYVSFYEQVTGSPAFPLRVMHHDAKIANVLFHKNTGELICLVDYDTVMPGYFFSDLGDMIRSMAGSEEGSGINNELKPDYYDAVVANYTEAMKDSLTETETNYIHYAGLLMIYMQCLRFLTDNLNGDIYYQTRYAEQNADRAANQFSLLVSLENYLEKKKLLQ